MNAPTIIGSAAVAAGATAAFIAQEVAVAAGAPRSTEDILKIITAVGGLVVVIGGVLAPIITMIVAAKAKKVLEPIATAVAAIGVQAVGIEKKVDGTASRMEKALADALAARDVALRTIDQLRADKADQKEIIIAQATAAPASSPLTVAKLEKDQA